MRPPPGFSSRNLTLTLVPLISGCGIGGAVISHQRRCPPIPFFGIANRGTLGVADAKKAAESRTVDSAVVGRNRLETQH